MKTLITLLLFMCLGASAATETDLSGSDAEFLMDSIKGGRNTPSGNPNQGVTTSMIFEVRRGGFDLVCKSSGMLFIKTACKLKLDPRVQDAAVQIREEKERTVVTFTDPDFVQGLRSGLVKNPWRSESKGRDGSELLNLFCETSATSPDKFCLLTLAN